MLKPLTQYVCDYCNEVIDDPADGYVEWLDSENPNGGPRLQHSFQICHTDCCQFEDDPDQNSIPLYDFIKTGKWMFTFGYLDKGIYYEQEYSGHRIKDMRQFVEFMKRMTIPYYEEARLYFRRYATEEDDFSPEQLLIEDTLKYIIKQYSEE